MSKPCIYNSSYGYSGNDLFSIYCPISPHEGILGAKIECSKYKVTTSYKDYWFLDNGLWEWSHLIDNHSNITKPIKHNQIKRMIEDKW